MALFHKLRVEDATASPRVLAESEPRRARIRLAVVLRIFVAAAFLAAAAYFTQERLFSTVSIDGVVTSPLISLRAPIEGQVVRVHTRPGVEMAAHDPLFVIGPSAAADDRLAIELKAKLQMLKTHLQQSIAKRESIAAVRQELELRRDQYTKATAERLRHMLAESHAQFKASVAAAERAKVEISRMSTLSSKGAASQSRLDDAVLARKNAEADVERQHSQTLRLEVELASAKRGIMIGEGYGDVPYSQQRIDELTIRLAELDAERIQIESAMADVEDQLLSEQGRAGVEAQREVLAPVAALVTATHVAEGTTISKHAPLADLIDCEGSFVEATLSERTYDAVRIGDAVRVQLYGNQSVIDGVVRSVRGSGIRTAAGGSAQVAATAAAMTVAVEIPIEALKRATAGTCQVGRIAKVMFDSRPPWRERVDRIVASLHVRLMP